MSENKSESRGLMRVKQVFSTLAQALTFRSATRSPDNRDVAIDQPVLYGAAAASQATTAAMRLSTVFACVKLITDAISQLPLIIYERADNGRIVARQHPLYYLLHDSPNADMTAVDFWGAIVSQLCLWGNAYCRITRSGSRIVSIDPLDPACMRIMRTANGDVRYFYTEYRKETEYSEADIWHVKGFGTTGLEGLSPVGVGWRSLAGAMAAEDAAGNIFSGGARASGIITVPNELSPDQRKQWATKLVNSMFGTQQNKLMLLEGGATYQAMTMNPVDAQMLETRTFSVEDICRWWNMPPSMIGHGTAVSNWGTGREQINLGFLTYVLNPFVKRIEKGISKHLMSPADRQKYYAEFSVEALLRADSSARAALYASAAQNGWMTRNEIRELENWPRLDGGDELTVQSNMVPVSMLGKITSTAQNDTIAQDTQGNDDELPD